MISTRCPSYAVRTVSRAPDEAPTTLGPRCLAVLTPREDHTEPLDYALAEQLSAGLAAFRLEYPL